MKAKNKEKCIAQVFCLVTLQEFEWLTTFAHLCWIHLAISVKKKLKSWNFPFQPFLNNILSGWCARSSHSYTRKQKASGEAANLKAKWNNSLQTIQNVSFDLKEILLKSLYQEKRKEEKKRIFFSHFGGFGQWPETSVIYAALITELQTSGCLNHTDSLLFTGDVTPLYERVIHLTA